MPIDTVGFGIKFLIPGSPLFLFISVAIALALLYGSPRLARIGRLVLTVIVTLYVVLSLQGTSNLLVGSLQRGERGLQTKADARGADTIVVLTNGALRIDLAVGGLGMLNGQSTYNALETARVYQMLGAPQVLVSGGPRVPPRGGSEAGVLLNALAELGIPRDHLHLEAESYNTHTQAINATQWLKGRGVTTFVLVTTPEHVWRAAGAFRKLGVQPIVSVSAIEYGGPQWWLPTGYALRGSTNAIYEYLAGTLYWLRGWT